MLKVSFSYTKVGVWVSEQDTRMIFRHFECLISNLRCFSDVMKNSSKKVKSGKWGFLQCCILLVIFNIFMTFTFNPQMQALKNTPTYLFLFFVEAICSCGFLIKWMFFQLFSMFKRPQVENKYGYPHFLFYYLKVVYLDIQLEKIQTNMDLFFGSNKHVFAERTTFPH